MILISYISGLINGKWSLIPTTKKQAYEVTFSCKKMKPNHPLLVFNGSAVTQLNEQEHLGLILESDLSFKTLMKK